MGSSRTTAGGGPPSGWNVFDAIKTLPSSPDAIMTHIDKVIAASEYAHATALLDAATVGARHDTRLADSAYRSGCAALSARKFGEALRLLRSALASCPPDKASAIAKLQSLIAFASQQIQKNG